MNLSTACVEIWTRVMKAEESEFELDGRTIRLGRTRTKGLCTVTFTFNDLTVEGIEQNPETNSRWAKLAQEGKRILQFRVNGRYIANVCEGELMRYPAWKALSLPE